MKENFSKRLYTNLREFLSHPRVLESACHALLISENFLIAKGEAKDTTVSGTMPSFIY